MAQVSKDSKFDPSSEFTESGKSLQSNSEKRGESFAVKLQDQEGKMSEKCSLDDVDSEIIKCNLYRFSTKESLEYLSSKGFSIKERTFFDRKKKLKEINNIRIISGCEAQIAKHFQVIDSLELIQKELYKNLQSTNDLNLKLKTAKFLRDNEIMLYQYNAAIPDVYDKQTLSLRHFSRKKSAHVPNFKDERKNGIRHLLEEKNPLECLPESFEPHILSEETKKRLKKELEELEAED